MLFNGIFNDNGHEKSMALCLQMDATQSYNAEVYLDRQPKYMRIEKDVCVLENVTYQYYIKKYSDEIIMAAKEISKFFHCLFPCFCRPRFFVVSNVSGGRSPEELV